MVNILVADDHPLFREAVSLVLNTSLEECNILEAEDVEQTLAMIQSHDDLDLILLDLNMPGSGGLNTLLEIRNIAPAVPVVIISAETNRKIILQTITYGAVGFVSKSSSKQEIGNAIEQILEGNVYLPADIIRADTETVQPKSRQHEAQISSEMLYTLTRKQLLVLKAMAMGSSNKQIAYDLNISETTVKSHVSAILKKLGVHNRTQAVVGLSNVDFDQYLKR
ncbi:response regulator transcription factor [Shewanella corallii]|uniref:Response regulator transcription factor n=2 Tax=Shewanella TaxID=22 RepID=A0ABT0N2S9_9GAMM|nr:MULTISPECIES: response regulator transcription factor [Shewanella]MCL1036144.1 response regulator transcription factor [Shewanella submarina]MCL2912756.1 response regulator transcription factor [Shewanella corallii]